MNARDQIAGVYERHRKMDDGNCTCGFVRSSIQGEGTFRLHFADQVIAALSDAGIVLAKYDDSFVASLCKDIDGNPIRFLVPLSAGEGL